MIISSDLTKKIGLVVETQDELLPLFPPLERCVIVALKEFVKLEQESAGDVGQNLSTADEHQKRRGQ